MKHIIDLGIAGEVEVDVDCDYTPGNEWLNPPEPVKFEVRGVFLNGMDITDLVKSALEDDQDLIDKAAEAEMEES